MVRKTFLVLLLGLSVSAIVYGGAVRTFMVYENIEKFEKLQSAGISFSKLPGMAQTHGGFKLQSQAFTEPEVVNAMTFDGISRYKDGRLMSNYADLRMLKGRRPCPT